MKKLLILIITFFISTTVLSQTYPTYDLDREWTTVKENNLEKWVYKGKDGSNLETQPPIYKNPKSNYDNSGIKEFICPSLGILGFFDDGNNKTVYQTKIDFKMGYATRVYDSNGLKVFAIEKEISATHPKFKAGKNKLVELVGYDFLDPYKIASDIYPDDFEISTTRYYVVKIKSSNKLFTVTGEDVTNKIDDIKNQEKLAEQRRIEQEKNAKLEEERRKQEKLNYEYALKYRYNITWGETTISYINCNLKNSSGDYIQRCQGELTVLLPQKWINYFRVRSFKVFDNDKQKEVLPIFKDYVIVYCEVLDTNLLLIGACYDLTKYWDNIYNAETKVSLKQTFEPYKREANFNFFDKTHLKPNKWYVYDTNKEKEVSPFYHNVRFFRDTKTIEGEIYNTWPSERTWEKMNFKTR